MRKYGVAAGTAAGALLALAVATCAGDRRTIGDVVRLDLRLDRIVPRGAVIEVLADGFGWAEGPVWDRAHGRLLFSDVKKNRVHSWSAREGLRTFLEPSGYTGDVPWDGPEPGSNGLTFDAGGRLVLCQHGDRRVARLEDDGTFTTLADRYEGRRFNSPNDLVYGPGGVLFFTDPPYGLAKTFEDPRREIGWNGVYRLESDGSLRVLVTDLRAPNGVALSPDGRTLYVAQSDPDHPVVMAYGLSGDGAVTSSRVVFDMKRLKGPGLPDGLKVDADGHLFATGPGGVAVLTPEGEHLGTIHTGVPTANCGFGDDGKALYLTANDMLCRIRLSTKGLGF
jgi:gluconolactonase